jgi:hypothetical protein
LEPRILPRVAKNKKQKQQQQQQEDKKTIIHLNIPLDLQWKLPMEHLQDVL